jgi:hypothetical protein
MKQVFEKIKVNSKFVNSYYYFTKDFIFFYFSCKKLKNNQKIIFEYLSDIKTNFISKYKEALIDNFSRAYKLIEAIEKSTEMGAEIEKENSVNIHLVEHLVDYIKKISQSFTDLYTQFAFTEDDFYFFSNKDNLITEMREIFYNEINNNYFLPIYNSIDKIFKLIESDETKINEKEMIYIQLVYFYNYILYKMSDVFSIFINSNISYLIKADLVKNIKKKIFENNTKLLKLFKTSFSTKIFLLNLNEKDYCTNMINDLINKSKLYFGEMNHINSLFFEINLIEFCLYCYFLCCISLLMSQNTFDGEYIDEILSNLITNISKELIRINRSDVVIKIHEFIKLLSCIENEEKLDEYKQIIGKSTIKKFLFSIKKIYFKPQRISKFLMQEKINHENFLHILIIMLMNKIKINSEQEIDFYFGQKEFMIKCMNKIEKELLNE